MWVVGVADSQTWSKPPQITPKIAFFDPNFTFRFPKSYKNPWVGKQIWDRSPKKKTFFGCLGGFENWLKLICYKVQMTTVNFQSNAGHRILSFSRNFLFGPAKVRCHIQPLGGGGGGGDNNERLN